MATVNVILTVNIFNMPNQIHCVTQQRMNTLVGKLPISGGVDQ